MTKPPQKRNHPLTIDQQVILSRTDPTTENIQALWQQVFTTRAWYLIPAKLGETLPMVIQEEQIILPIFTSFRKLNIFAKAQGLSKNGEVVMLTLSPYEVILNLKKYIKHIDIIVFNIGGDAAFRTTPELLIQYANHFRVLDFSPEN